MPPKTVCVVTSCAANAEPRAPRHALAALEAFPGAEIVFVETTTLEESRRAEAPLLKQAPIKKITHVVPTRQSDFVAAGRRKLGSRIAQLQYRLTGEISEPLFGSGPQGLGALLRRVNADIIVAHNIETLLPAASTARATGAALMFDCMEYYSDMGDEQSLMSAKAAEELERRYLPACALVLASSEPLAQELSAKYAIAAPLAAYNCPPTETALPEKIGGGLNLYWRNRVIGFGQRGLEDVLVALTLLPRDVRLFLQGGLPRDNGRALMERIRELGIADRVTILPPYAPGDAVKQAALYDVGLCLERKGPRNHDLTVSNKMFDYHMGGLAIISSDLLGLTAVISESRGGLLYPQANVRALADQIERLRSNRDDLRMLQQAARKYALEIGNSESVSAAIVQAMKSAISARAGAIRDFPAKAR